MCIFIISCSSFLNTKQDICGQFVIVNNKNAYNTAIDFIKTLLPIGILSYILLSLSVAKSSQY